MRSLSGSSVTTFLMFVPLLAVPLLAIFGIPEFSPVNASPSVDENHVLQVSDREPVDGRSEKHSTDDLFAEVEKRAEFAADFKRLDVERREDPFQSSTGDRNPAKTHNHDSTTAKNSRLAGWTVDANRRRHSGAMRPQRPLSKREPMVAAANTEKRNPFANGPDRRSQEASTERTQPKSFPDFANSRERFNAKQRRIGPAESSASAGERSRKGSPLLSIPLEAPRSSEGSRASNKAMPGGRLTWRSAVKRLNSLGIHDFRLQPGRQSGEFHFSCTFIPHQGTRVTHRFEAEDTEPLKAVGHVIAQIESWLRRR